MEREEVAMQTTTAPINSSITIDAPIDRVWQAITTPSQIKRWFLGVDTETDWQVGSPIVHRGEYEGRPYIDKGEILSFEPPRLLRHSHWSDLSGRPDAPDAYQVVSWALAEVDGSTRVVITETNLPSDEAAQLSESTWTTILRNLKSTLEA
jgi:uncharacterized protein YndB with AHSA1/START domain